MIRHITAAVLAACMAFALLPTLVGAQTPAPATSAEQLRSALVRAQIDLASDPAQAHAALDAARAIYFAQFAPTFGTTSGVAMRAQAGFAGAATALSKRDAAAFATARAQIWTALLEGSYAQIDQALRQGDAKTAQIWLPLREFRHATRFSRPNADATRAIDAAIAGSGSTSDALLALQADLLDTYQARLTEALHDLAVAEGQGFGARRAEAVSLAEGYFAILAPAYAEQRGTDRLKQAQQAFSQLHDAATPEASKAAQAAVAQVLQGFRAAPLNAEEQARRAGQMIRFLNLVPIEYGRGVSGRNVTRDLEIREATTFRDGAAAAFNDLRTLLEAHDAVTTAQVAGQFTTLEQQLRDTTTRARVATPDEVQATTDTIARGLAATMPQAWQQRNSAGDFDVIDSMLDQMQAAVAAGQYDLAESARLEAYAVLESGPEAKLVVFAPQMKTPIEDLFWFGQGDNKGLAQLLKDTAPASEIKASRKALDAQLAAAEQALKGNNAPVAVASNAAIIVFREGLEAVLILASLLGSFKTAEMKPYRRPMWLGAAAALLFSALTWVLAQGVLTSLARYGEKLEAVVSLVAIAVLLLITNWFFHQIYWTGWMANFHQQKKRLVGGEAGKWLGLLMLGFTSIYREGFETVLFLQALVLEAGAATVLGGVAVGLAATFAIGLLVFAVQAKLPHKKMLIYTGVLIGVVLLQMVGNTVHVMQVVGWLPTHPIRWLADLLPYWMGLWFGVYATWEGLLLQFAAAAFVIGSYVLAERQKHAKPVTAKPQARAAASQ